MRPAVVFALFGLCFLTSGCALVEDATRNTLVTLARPVERHHEWKRNRAWAEQAWQQVCAGNATPHSKDYANGFREGYAEYLFRGGDGEPPLVAPLCYRGVRYQTPQGYTAIDDWFAGYRHGAAAAKASGARELITGPSSLRAAGPPLAKFVTPTPSAVPVVPSAPAELPPPRLAPPAGGKIDHPKAARAEPPMLPSPRAQFGTLTTTAAPARRAPPVTVAPRAEVPAVVPPLTMTPGRLLSASPEGVQIPEVSGWPDGSRSR